MNNIGKADWANLVRSSSSTSNTPSPAQHVRMVRASSSGLRLLSPESHTSTPLSTTRLLLISPDSQSRSLVSPESQSRSVTPVLPPSAAVVKDSAVGRSLLTSATKGTKEKETQETSSLLSAILRSGASTPTSLSPSPTCSPPALFSPSASPKDITRPDAVQVWPIEKVKKLGVRFSQRSIGANTSAGESLRTCIPKMLKEGLTAPHAINVVRMGRRTMVSFDNRRLYVAYQANEQRGSGPSFNVAVRLHNAADPCSVCEREKNIVFEQAEYVNCPTEQEKWRTLPEGIKEGTWGAAVIWRTRGGHDVTLENACDEGYPDVYVRQ